MATIETNAVASLFGSYQSERELSEGFGLHFPKGADLWRAGDAFASNALIRAFPNDEATSLFGETVLRSDEVTREAISFARRPVVIEVTDEQAQQLHQFQGRGHCRDRL
jgi:hypothetical protein